jgi:tRNA(fMet)-specific endonuclease VapC
MKHYLLDTNILVLHLRKPDYLQQLYAQLSIHPSESLILLSVVSVAELRSLAHRRGWGEQRLQTMENFFLDTSVIDISVEDQHLLNEYVDIDVNSINIGHKMSKNDLWIAATAAVANATLVTADKDFDHLTGRMNIIKMAIN